MVLPKVTLASFENLAILDSPDYNPAASTSGYIADLSNSDYGTESKSQDLHTEEPLPEAKTAPLNSISKSVPADEVTIFIGYIHTKEDSFRFGDNVVKRDAIRGRYTLSAEVNGDHLDLYCKKMGYKNKDDYVFSKLKCFQLFKSIPHKPT